MFKFGTKLSALVQYVHSQIFQKKLGNVILWEFVALFYVMLQL